MMKYDWCKTCLRCSDVPDSFPTNYMHDHQYKEESKPVPQKKIEKINPYGICQDERDFISTVYKKQCEIIDRLNHDV